MNRAARLAVLLGVLALLATPACSHKDDGTTPRETQDLPALTVRDDTPNLMLTWLDEKGDTHVELHPADVPAAGRELVRVVVSDREDGTRDVFYVVDLARKREDGAYTARSMSRRVWEAEIERRRDAYLAKIAPPKAPPPPSPPSGDGPRPPVPSATADLPPPAGVQVIIYGASWCKPCHQAADYLKSKGIPYVLKDIEENPAAQVEMRDKLEKSGQRGGSIPVIDVRGQILIGFSPGAIDRALAKARGGTVL